MENDNKKMSTTHKALIGLGALSGVAGLAGLGKQIGNVMVKKKQLGLFASEAKKATDEFGPRLKFLSKKLEEAKNNPGFLGIKGKLKKAWYGPQALIKKNEMEGKFYEAAELARDKEQEFRNAIPKHIVDLDRNLLLAGSGGVATGLYFGTKTAELVATKESISIPKPVVRPNLLSLPTNYSKMTQSGEIIENADKMDKIATLIGYFKDGSKVQFSKEQSLKYYDVIKHNPGKRVIMDKDGKMIIKEQLPKSNPPKGVVMFKDGKMVVTKIAEAVNSLFPREPKSKDKIIKKQSLEIDKRDEALAVREQELMQKHENLKQIQKAVKDTNKKLEFYKQKAVENYSQALEHESNAN